MSLFFETIKIKNGDIFNLKYHNLRLNRTISDIFGIKTDFNLRDFIQTPNDNEMYRCKVIYSDKIESVSFELYKPRVFNSFKVIEHCILYPYKSVYREEIDKLYERREGCDDIILVKDGLVQDTSIANIAIYDGLKWYTPKTPLLQGTQRAKLLKNEIIIEKDIQIKYFKNIVSFAIINALLGFQEIKDAKLHMQGYIDGK